MRELVFVFCQFFEAQQPKLWQKIMTNDRMTKVQYFTMEAFRERERLRLRLRSRLRLREGEGEGEERKKVGCPCGHKYKNLLLIKQKSCCITVIHEFWS